MEKKASFIAVFEYLIFNLPWWIIQVLPVAVLLAVLFSLGGLARTGEITALKAAGVNLWRIIILFLAAGLFISMMDIVLREKIIPFTVKHSEKVRIEKIRKEKLSRTVEFNDLVVSLPDNGRMTIGYLNAKEGRIWRIVIDYYNDSFQLARQIVAEEGKWTDNKWIMENGVERIFNSGGFKETGFKEKELSLPFDIEDFILVKTRPEQMSTKEFKDYINQLKTLGVPPEKEIIRLYSRWAVVFSHIIVMLIGIPFALGLGSHHGKIISFTFALILAFIYWGLQAVGQSLGENGLISPILSAWLGNIVFGVIGTVLLLRIKK
jgi:lipopolysaccharide export system permease protein